MSFSLTRTGTLFFAAPGDYSYTLEEIVMALANITRFNGHIDISVLEHSLRLSLLAERHGQPVDVQFALLVHDFHEAYIGDITSPIVAELCRRMGNSIELPSAINGLKDDLDSAISVALEWPGRILQVLRSDCVKQYDWAAVWQESRFPTGQVLATIPTFCARYERLLDRVKGEIGEKAGVT